MTKEDLVEELYDRGLIPEEEEVILSDGFEEALLGITATKPRRAIYDYWKCVDLILKSEEDLTFDEVLDWMEVYLQETFHNVEPLFIKKV